MDRRDAANRDLLIGLLALQNGLVEEDMLILAFQAWTCDKSRPIAEMFLQSLDRTLKCSFRLELEVQKRIERLGKHRHER
jgi:hypothetical protein